MSHRLSVTKAIWGWFSVTNLNLPNPYLLTSLNVSPYIFVSLNHNQTCILSASFHLFLSRNQDFSHEVSHSCVTAFLGAPTAKSLTQTSPVCWEERDHIQSWMLTLAHACDPLHRSVCSRSGKWLLSLPISYVLPVLTSEVLNFFWSTFSTIWWAVFLQDRY